MSNVETIKKALEGVTPVAWSWKGPKGGFLADDKQPAWPCEPLYSASTLEALQRENEEQKAWIKTATLEITKAIGGGSEMFTQHGDDFRVDPAFVASFIQFRRERHAEYKKASIKKEREILARAETAEAEVKRLSAAEPSVAVKQMMTVEEYVDGYCWRGDEGDYTPNEQEKALLIDALHGAVGEVDADFVFASRHNNQAGECEDTDVDSSVLRKVREKMAATALTAQVQDVAVPEGWQLVPNFATVEMEAAAVETVKPFHDISDQDWRSSMPKDLFRIAWKAMLAAAPAKQDDQP